MKESLGLCLCVWRAVPGQDLTLADGALAHVAWLAGAQVSSDGVGADGIFITHIFATCTLIMFCGGETEEEHIQKSLEKN